MIPTKVPMLRPHAAETSSAPSPARRAAATLLAAAMSASGLFLCCCDSAPASKKTPLRGTATKTRTELPRVDTLERR
jgi:hypothetical protein